jgi:hypothetical protein
MGKKKKPEKPWSALEAARKATKEIEGMTKDEFLAFMLRAGILTENGELTAIYR